jgi:dTMP kinase
VTPRNSPGYFITFEGNDGCGKTTQIECLKETLEGYGLAGCTVFVREPGGTEFGSAMRWALLDKEYTQKVDVRAEALGFEAARAQLVNEVILPNLLAGNIVISDRFYDSTTVYQGYTQGVGCFVVDQLNRFATNNLVPNLTILLDIDPSISIGRKNKGHIFNGEDWNRLDELQLVFYGSTAQAYRMLHAFDTEGRWELINADGTLDEVRIKVEKLVLEKLAENGIMETTGTPERRG